jgi:Tfp pilus assembly protein PilZ
MRDVRAPRQRKRISCELIVNDSRYSGIILDISATGMFIQTTLKPGAGEGVTVYLKIPGRDETIRVDARVARKKMVPPQLLAVAQGGIGLAIPRPSAGYLDFLVDMGPEHAEFVARERSQRRPPGRATPSGANSPKRFRVHAVDASSGRKNSYLMTAATEEQASERVLAELGDDWKILFIERA